MNRQDMAEHDQPMANREEPIPVFRLPTGQDRTPGDAAGSSDQEPVSTRERLRGQADKIRSKLESLGNAEGRQSLQDRVLASIIAQVIPTDGPGAGSPDELSGTPTKKDRRSKKYVDRPEFGPRLMAYNFRRFNSRIGVVFALENRCIVLFTWRNPSATLSFLAVYSLLCLNPHLLPLVPLLLLLFGIMIPAFLARHPTPKNDPRITPSFRGPPTAPASRVKPAPELSTDFWRNMRDLQNSMEDFSRLHDTANEYIAPLTNFSDEPLSSTLFVAVFLLACAAFVCGQLLPWRTVALAAGWLLTCAGHPAFQNVLLSTQNVSNFRQHMEMAQSLARFWVEDDVVMDEPAEVRQVEIFELQKHHASSDTWESWLFSPTPHEPLSPARISGSRPKGTQFFEDVQAPAGWTWKEKKWTLDLNSREWVEQGMVSGVEIETEGERWVYDIAVDQPDLLTQVDGMAKKQSGKAIPKSGWEEGTGSERRGEWRRRRWTRLVQKKASKGIEDEGS